MTDAATYARGAELGFDGLDFYIGGPRRRARRRARRRRRRRVRVLRARRACTRRGTRAAAVMPAPEAAREWAAVRARVGERAPRRRGRLADASPTCSAASSTAAPVAGAPLFAGLAHARRARERRESARVHRLNALRELRGALHGAAVLTVGLTPVEAIVVRAPATARRSSAGPSRIPIRRRCTTAGQLAEARTDRMFGRHLAVLDAAERAELVELLGELCAS